MAHLMRTTHTVLEVVAAVGAVEVLTGVDFLALILISLNLVDRSVRVIRV